jgi:hypothetical protein
MGAIPMRREDAQNACAVVRALVGPAAWERHGGKWMHRANTHPERVCAAIVLVGIHMTPGEPIRDVEAYLERCWISAEGRLHRFNRA